MCLDCTSVGCTSWSMLTQLATTMWCLVQSRCHDKNCPDGMASVSTRHMNVTMRFLFIPPAMPCMGPTSPCRPSTSPSYSEAQAFPPPSARPSKAQAIRGSPRTWHLPPPLAPTNMAMLAQESVSCRLQLSNQPALHVVLSSSSSEQEEEVVVAVGVESSTSSMMSKSEAHAESGVHEPHGCLCSFSMAHLGTSEHHQCFCQPVGAYTHGGQTIMLCTQMCVQMATYTNNQHVCKQ